MGNANVDKEKIDQLVVAVTDSAMKLHDIMEFGQSILVQVAVKPAIITPGKHQEVKTMLITKPAMIVSIMPPAGIGPGN